MRLWPKSLVGQLLLAVALTLFVAQSANLWLLDRAQREQFVVQVGGVAAARIYDVVERERRDGAALAPGAYLRGRVTISLTPPETPLGARPMPKLAAHVREVLAENGIAIREARAWHFGRRGKGRREIGPEARAERRMPARALVSVYDGTRWISVRGRAPQSGDRLSALLIGQTLLLYLVLLVPIVLIAWRVSRPLNELTNSVRGAMPGDRAAPLTPRGPNDVRDLMGAFNLFRARIDTMMADKDRMLGAVGHDLRTPLASLRVRVEQVADDGLRAKMIASIDELAAMLNDILAVARSGAGVEAATRIRLGPWLDALVAEYAERGLAVTRAPGADDAAFVGRAMLLARAVRNLIDNGLAYGTRAEVRLDAAPGTVAIIIADQGPGIDPARVADLMEPFARGEESRSRATGGSGLGLAIAKMVAEGEGGSLDLFNRADEAGLEARIILPN
jgi:signal transduction histidine kinase